MRLEKLRKVFLYLPAPAAFILLLLKADVAAEAARAGLDLCMRSVIPSLFPALVLTNLLIRTGLPPRLLNAPGSVFERLFHIRKGALTAYLTGLVGGYPLGAAAAAECCRLGDCSEEEAGRLLVFANNCSPAFLFGMVGSRGADGWRHALLLLIIQWSLSLWLGVFLGVGCSASQAASSQQNKAASSFPVKFTSSVRNGGRSILLICAYVVFFSVFTAFLPEHPLLRGFFELTGGLMLTEAGESGLVVSAFLLGWGGLSVLCQVYSCLEGSGIPAGKYLPYRILLGLLMAVSVLLYRIGSAYLLLMGAGLTAAIFVKRSRNMRHADI